MTDLGKIKKPALILDEIKCRKNIANMAAKARLSQTIFRPHFKTHQSAAIGEWFRDEGTRSITVSSVTMAQYFALSGWKDITVAFPLNMREAENLHSLASMAEVNILTPNSEHIDILKNKISSSTGCFIKINTGNNRSGTDWDDTDEIQRIAEKIRSAKNLHFKGFLTHAGHSYKASSKDKIIEIYNDTISKLRSAKDLIPDAETIISTGDTPSCSLVENFNGVDEVRPGNFVFYDLMQLKLGSCSAEQIAVAVACPVVEKNKRKREIIIYGGAVHLSRESLKLSDGRIVFGQVVMFHNNGWIFPDEEVYIRSISQEHGIISAPGSFFDRIGIGDLAGIIPVHSCLTADLLRKYHIIGGEVITDFSPK